MFICVVIDGRNDPPNSNQPHILKWFKDLKWTTLYRIISMPNYRLYY